VRSLKQLKKKCDFFIFFHLCNTAHIYTNLMKTMAPTADVVTLNSPIEPYYSHGLRERYRLDAFKMPVTRKEQVYADIGYRPDYAKYLDRSASRIHAGGLESDVPNGWPKVVNGPLVWTATDFNDETEFVHSLSEVEKAEIEEALRNFRGRAPRL